MAETTTQADTHHSTPVLVVGAGPAGLIAALQLAVNGTPCMLIERNLDTTKWPKMDLTNCRSMEILKRLGIAEGLREVGVEQHYSLDVNFSTGLSPGGELLTKWDLPSPDKWRELIREKNDGSGPSEPYQRCSQAVFEAWLKPRIQAQPLIKSIFGWTFQGLVESDDGVVSTLVDIQGGKHIVSSEYVIGCDGAGSRVRRSIGVNLTGGPVPGAMFLIHFKSRDISRLHVQGQFWHIFFTSGAVIISQDEVDTWTMHIPVPIGTDVSAIDPYEAIYRGLGGHFEPYHITVDEILVKSIWRPNLYLADQYLSQIGRVFLSGDAAHQNVPTGGYGMNMAVGDSFDIGWKIAAVLAGHGGPALLRSYEEERRPVAQKNIDQSGVHFMVHEHYWQKFRSEEKPLSFEGTEWEELKQDTISWIQEHDGENKDIGIELGYRYRDSNVIVKEPEGSEPQWSRSSYVPSTWPGARAPHVYLQDGKTSIFDRFGTGQEYTLVDFTATGQYIIPFKEVADQLNVPTKIVHLPNEEHVRHVWERDAVLVRPDDHVAWRAPGNGKIPSLSEVEEVMMVALGRKASAKENGHSPGTGLKDDFKAFSGTIGVVNHETVDDLAAFQK